MDPLASQHYELSDTNTGSDLIPQSTVVFLNHMLPSIDLSCGKVSEPALLPRQLRSKPDLVIANHAKLGDTMSTADGGCETMGKGVHHCYLRLRI